MKNVVLIFHYEKIPNPDTLWSIMAGLFESLASLPGGRGQKEMLSKSFKQNYRFFTFGYLIFCEIWNLNLNLKYAPTFQNWN